MIIFPLLRIAICSSFSNRYVTLTELSSFFKNNYISVVLLLNPLTLGARDGDRMSLRDDTCFYVFLFLIPVPSSLRSPPFFLMRILIRQLRYHHTRIVHHHLLLLSFSYFDIENYFFFFMYHIFYCMASHWFSGGVVQ